MEKEYDYDLKDKLEFKNKKMNELKNSQLNYLIK